MEIIIQIGLFCLGLLILNIAARYFATKFNKKKGEKVLKFYGQEDFKKIDVKISETIHSYFTSRGGTVGFLNATLHYSENLLIFTQHEDYTFEAYNNTLPLVINLKTVRKLIIKSDEYILYVGKYKLEKEIQVYSEKENDALKSIFNNFKLRISELEENPV